jgi:hypothetical protein
MEMNNLCFAVSLNLDKKDNFHKSLGLLTPSYFTYYLLIKKGDEMTMNKIALMAGLVLLIGLAFYPIEGKAQMGPGYGYGYGMGPGMMGPGYGYGYGMGPGMMGPGYGYGYCPQYQQPQYQQSQKPLDEKGAKTILENYLRSTRNPNLKLGKIEDKGDEFEADILTKGGSLVDKILVSKNNGWMHSAY